VITTNYTVKGIGGSFERRKFEVELSSYFGVDRTPYDVFGHMLFDDWNDNEFLKFDNFMVLCVQYYLGAGIVQHEYKNLEARKFINQTCFEFYEWAMEGNIPLNQDIVRAELFNTYIDEFPDQKKWLSHKRFANWISDYCKFTGFEMKKAKFNGIRTINIISL
jgi:hypothetical protein